MAEHDDTTEQPTRTTARAARRNTGSVSMRIAGLVDTKQALEVEFIKSMRSISSWISDVAAPDVTDLVQPGLPRTGHLNGARRLSSGA